MQSCRRRLRGLNYESLFSLSLTLTRGRGQRSPRAAPVNMSAVLKLKSSEDGLQIQFEFNTAYSQPDSAKAFVVPGQLPVKKNPAWSFKEQRFRLRCTDGG